MHVKIVFYLTPVLSINQVPPPKKSIFWKIIYSLYI